jgi:hypothetical protein
MDHSVPAAAGAGAPTEPECAGGATAVPDDAGVPAGAETGAAAGRDGAGAGADVPEAAGAPADAGLAGAGFAVADLGWKVMCTWPPLPPSPTIWPESVL